MMSSEEESDGFGLYNDKLLKKAKRSRQRVDAGEPRNSYSSIPNFSSRPNFINSGIYGAFFSQNQQHFGFFGQGFGPNKMLNELLGRQVKTGSEANIPADNMMTIDPNSAEANNYEAQVLRRSLDEDVSPPPGDIAAHHMLRDILQGRKKELLALEHEFRGVNTNGTEPNSPDNNNCINNNNNNELKNTNINLTNGLDNSESEKHNMMNGDSEMNDLQDDGDNASNPEENQNEVSDKINSLDEENLNDGEVSDSEHSVHSSSSDIKKELDDPDLKDLNSNDKSDQVELKRARVENIVSTMRSSPSLPTQVNGCKKRKLYHPQQHDNSLTERYANLNNNNISPNLNMLLEEDEDEDLGPEEIRQKVVEKNALKNQLRSMQEQLAAMQQKYVRLCTKMETEPNEPQEIEDVTSDVEQDNNNTPVKPEVSTPATTPVKETPSTPNSTPVSQPVMSPAISKMISAKLHHQQQNGPHMNPHGLPLPPNFNGALSLLQQQVLQEQHPQGIPMPPHHHPHHHPHPAMGPHALSNAAAMYLGVRFMEQEARMAKEAAMAAEHHQQQQQRNSGEHHGGPPPQNHPQRNQNEPMNPSQPRQSPHPNMNHKNEFNERLSMLRNSALHPIAGPVELENLADVLKSEITSSLSNLIDSIIARFIQQRRMMGKQSEASAAAEQLNKDLLLASQLLDRKSQRTKVIDRGNSGAASERERSSSNGSNQREPPRMNTAAFPTLPLPPHHPNNNNPENNINTMNLPQIRPSPMFQAPKTPTSSMSSAAAAAAAAIYSMGGLHHPNPFSERDVREERERERNAPEQNEALSLVVQPKKKRHKVTDTRITPRTVSRILAQDNMRGPTPPSAMDLNKFNLSNLMNQHSNSNNNLNGNNSSQMNSNPMNSNQNSNTGSESPQRVAYHPPPPPPPMLPVSLPTSVAIPNPSLHESQVFSPYSPFYNAHVGQNPHLGASSPPNVTDLRDSPPLPPHPTMLHPALLAAAHGGSPDFSNMRGGGDSMDMVSDEFGNEAYDDASLTLPHSSTLTPMHLRKAKLMFFWVRYPSSAVLKMYFPDIKFNKNNTAQLVKWFSNFREFYYIQMEKYARQAVSEGVLHAEDLHVSGECEIYRVLNLHYNRNNHIEVCGPQVPTNFRFVIEQTLREFFKAIQDGKDQEPSWKKSIYKIISRMDDPVPEYFKSPNFLEQLE
ncbi:hypothetical protein M8J76_004958 [Diaphorina citri]|nr:hypothetical protein M8J76_004958 [Diaphorina citri]